MGTSSSLRKRSVDRSYRVEMCRRIGAASRRRGDEQLGTRGRRAWSPEPQVNARAGTGWHGREGSLNPQVLGSSPRGYSTKALVSKVGQGLRHHNRQEWGTEPDSSPSSTPSGPLIADFCVNEGPRRPLPSGDSSPVSTRTSYVANEWTTSNWAAAMPITRSPPVLLAFESDLEGEVHRHPPHAEPGQLHLPALPVLRRHQDLVHDDVDRHAPCPPPLPGKPPGRFDRTGRRAAQSSRRTSRRPFERDQDPRLTRGRELPGRCFDQVGRSKRCRMLASSLTTHSEPGPTARELSWFPSGGRSRRVRGSR
jgi:hypothetical protein